MSSEVTQLDRIEGLVTQLVKNVGSLRSETYAFRNEMYSFRDEMYSFRDEMYSFRDEMYAFRAEMYTFRDGVNQRFDTSQRQQDNSAEQVSLIHHRLDHQLNRIAKVEEDIHILKQQT